MDSDSHASFSDHPDLTESLDLVQRAQAGDERALNDLLARYQDRLHAIARVEMGARLREAMESMDLVQRTNEVAMRKLPDFEQRDHASIVHWLRKILRNQIRDARDYIDAEKRDRRREVRLEPSAASSQSGFHPEGRDPTPSQEAMRAESQAIYHACVAELHPDHREVVILREYEDGSWEHVCERMGRPNVHAVQELYRRARIRLARIFARKTKALGLDSSGAGSESGDSSAAAGDA